MEGVVSSTSLMAPACFCIFQNDWFFYTMFVHYHLISFITNLSILLLCSKKSTNNCFDFQCKINVHVAMLVFNHIAEC